jgi:hypothetical protein
MQREDPNEKMVFNSALEKGLCTAKILNNKINKHKFKNEQVQNSSSVGGHSLLWAYSDQHKYWV